jgi:hypothetical protein
MKTTSYFAAAALGLTVAFFAYGAEALDEKTPDILAAQIRDQGYACNKAQSAQREQKESAPNETVWILTCEDDTYRMTLVPDMGARVEKLSK